MDLVGIEPTTPAAPHAPCPVVTTQKLEPDRGKLAVRNLRGDDGNGGIIRSPIRAIPLSDPISSHTRRTASGKGSRGTCNQGRSEEARRDAGAVLPRHSTGEGGEPRGSRKERPRNPLEGNLHAGVRQGRELTEPRLTYTRTKLETADRAKEDLQSRRFSSTRNRRH